jgi:hypothetical protein
MIRLEHGRSYIWLFAIFMALFFGGFALFESVGDVKWGILTIPAFLTFLLLCEIRSGVALDPWWRASHLKGSGRYQATLAYHAVLVPVFCIFSWFYIH